MAAAAAAGWPAVASAQAVGVRARQNVDYRLIPPQPVPPGDVVEVIEFFWYGCPYCAQLQPYLHAWLARQPADVVFRLVPAVFRPSWIPHARIFFALEALGELNRLHEQVYAAYHGEHLLLDRTDEIADWAERQGIARERWLTAYQSEAIDAKVDAARDALRRYAVAGTPTLVVDGRYLVSSAMTPGVAAMMPILDDLVVLAREQRATH